MDKASVPLFERVLQAQPLRLRPLAERQPIPRAGDRAAWGRIAEEYREGLIRWGEQAFAGYPARPATAFMAFVRSGDRQADERPYFERRRLLIAAAIAECVEHQGRFLDAVIDGLWVICEETSWVISAHNGSSHIGTRPASERPLPDPDNPYIDLFAAQTSATLSYVIFLLRDELDQVAPLIVRRVLKEIDRRIIKPFFHHDDFWWMGFIRKDLNNWTPWILSNVIDSLLLSCSDELLITEGLIRAMRMLDSYLLTLPADGGIDEGVSYWNVAGGSLLDCLESLRRATGIDLYDDPLIRGIGAFPACAHIAGEWFWNFADCDAKPMLDGERLYTYGLRTGNAALMNLGAAVHHGRPIVPPRETPQMNRLLYGLFTEIPKPVADKPGDRSTVLPALQVFAFERQGLYAAIKAGHNGESHNHNDVGNFIVYLHGEPRLVDAGNLVYTAKTFSARRYELWNTRSANHNLALIGGFEQVPGEAARAKDVQWTENSAAMELACTYPAEAGIKSYKRSLAHDGQIRLDDGIQLADKAQTVEWVFMARLEPKQAAPGLLKIGDLLLEHDPALRLEVKEIPIEDVRMARSYPGSLWRISLQAEAALEHHQRFVIREDQ